MAARPSKYDKLSAKSKLNARSLRVVTNALNEAVREFRDERGVTFRERVLGNEAYINVAVWYLLDRPRDEQEAILRAYIPRIESYLLKARAEPANGDVIAAGPADGFAAERPGASKPQAKRKNA